ncbi:competence protein ComGD [Bacillus ectoiniformans]|uniref:competence type IV pilus minor pilin ComGD n=1 Tax=Bacillus ectoiniformans TaxID=1494429 RepID=UPI001957CE8C|nr:competence type IV pilus minor pilin ComGD [Bacillus ectoiniformans]MBM7650465.1 competence protein ComGD [Bacillus ectoiniformans]
MNEKGVSLLEVLLVLSVIIVLLMVTVLPFPKMFADIEKKQFVNQLQTDLFYAQSYSISNQVRVNIKFFPGSQGYQIKTIASPSHVLVIRTFPDMIRYVNGTISEILYLPNGNTNRFGSAHFKCQDQLVQLVFQIGKGRFYVKDE